MSLVPKKYDTQTYNAHVVTLSLVAFMGLALTIKIVGSGKISIYIDFIKAADPNLPGQIVLEDKDLPFSFENSFIGDFDYNASQLVNIVGEDNESLITSIEIL